MGWIYDDASAYYDYSIPAGISSVVVIQALIKLFALRGTVMSRKDYAERTEFLSFESDQFMPASDCKSSFLEVAQSVEISDEYNTECTQLQDEIMQGTPSKKKWQLALVLATYLTVDVARLVKEHLPSILRMNETKMIAEFITDKISHPFRMFPRHSIFGKVRRSELEGMSRRAAKRSMVKAKHHISYRTPHPL